MNILWNTKHITKFTKLIQISIQTLLSLKKILLYLYTYLSFSNTIYTKYEKKNKKKYSYLYLLYTISNSLIYCSIFVFTHRLYSSLARYT